jgi:GTP-binding protein
LLNVFALDEARRLVDLPGYGYAKVPEAVRERWAHAIDDYLRGRESLRGVVLIMDSRHPLKDFDRQMLAFCRDIDLACHVLLTKADKLSRSEGARTLAVVRKECAAQGWPATAQLFSSLAKTGLDEARATLAGLLAG